MKTLEDLTVLSLDCQATHANPAKGHLLELGWAATSASEQAGLEAEKVSAFLLRVPDQAIPNNVTRVTGITPDDLKQALNPNRVWELLKKDVKVISSGQPAISIIHFARFEEPHLRALSQRSSGDQDLPFQILCTHKITKRLVPHLPRKGLRAVAGYFGYSIPEKRRSASHVAATAFVWKHIVHLLEKEQKIQTLDELRDWLHTAEAKTPERRKYPMEPGKRLALPDKPGVYRMLRSNGDLLYVGKATSLKQRVNSYFRKQGRMAEHTLEMLTQARDLDFTVTSTSLEAALLEADEIKGLSPPYNIALREKDRDLVFTTRDFKELVDHPDDLHRLGPFPRRVAEPVSHIVKLAISGQPTNEECLDIWQIHSSPESYPDPECLKLGWSLFSTRYALEFSNPSRFLLQLGAQLWIKRREERENAALESEAKEDSGEENSWTPERVCRLLESRLLSAAHWARKARWFRMLSNSSVAWTPRNSSDKERVLLVLQSGTIVKRETVGPGTNPPAPPGCRTSPMELLEQLDPVVLDRLRVLTTELRRLVGEGRNPRVRLSPALILKREKLNGLLQWV